MHPPRTHEIGNERHVIQKGRGATRPYYQQKPTSHFDIPAVVCDARDPNSSWKTICAASPRLRRSCFLTESARLSPRAGRRYLYRHCPAVFHHRNNTPIRIIDVPGYLGCIAEMYRQQPNIRKRIVPLLALERCRGKLCRRSSDRKSSAIGSPSAISHTRLRPYMNNNHLRSSRK